MIASKSNKMVSGVFGISKDVRKESYVDRGNLDEEISRHLGRDESISLRGASKSGKSWLRQKLIPNANVIQCRLNTQVNDIYGEALSELGIKLSVTESRSGTFRGSVEATTSLGAKLLSLVDVGGKFAFGLEQEKEHTEEFRAVKRDITNLAFVAEIIRKSQRRLVIEDVHYLGHDQRVRLAYDLKALWEFGVYVVIVGVWERQSLIDLNPELTLKMEEFSIEWKNDELMEILDKGGQVLNLEFGDALRQYLAELSYGNAGLLQTLALETLDSAGIDRRPDCKKTLCDLSLADKAATKLAKRLQPLYQSFAKRTAAGIRTRTNSTGIYAHAMSAIMSFSDEQLIHGLSVKAVFEKAHDKEPRILLPNLRSALKKIDSLQVDSDGRGLVVTYDEGSDEITVVDRQILLYRRYLPVHWAWEDEIDTNGKSGEAA